MIEIETRVEEFTYEIIVAGEVDASSSIHLDNALSEAFEKANKIAINLTALNYISSAGLGVFISRLEEIKEKEIRMILYGLNEKVFEVFSILGLGDLLEIEDDRERTFELLHAK